MKKIISAVLAVAMLLAVLTACSSNGGSNLTGDDLAKIINDNGDEMTEYNPAVALNSGNEDLNNLITWNEWDKAKFADGAFSFSLMNVQAYTIAIVKPADGEKDAVMKYFEDYKAQMIQNFERYLEEELEIAKAAVLEEVDGYILFVMTENADTIAANIKAKL